MYEDVLIEKLDHFGRGISYINNKIVFVKNALPTEIVDIKITYETKKYQEGEVIKYKTKSPKRVLSKCPYFNICGGCNLQMLSYEDNISFKHNKVKELLTKNKIPYQGTLNIIKNSNPLNYRNKVSVKIRDNKIGFFEDSTHRLVPITECKLAKIPINIVLKNYKLLNIKEADLTIRCNTNDEILLIINTLEKEYNIELEKLKKQVKLVGIIYNDKVIYGEPYFYERINGFLFKVSYNSFFQVNHLIAAKLFELVSANIKKDSNTLDLYSGVGTLSLVASKKSKNVIGIEIIPNAVINSNYNAKLNNQKNINFLLGDVSKIISKINYNFDNLIIDPPRKGLDTKTINFIIANKPLNIIYISCDVFTLMRDLKILISYYEIKEYNILDMFSYTYHIESFCVLSLR